MSKQPKQYHVITDNYLRSAGLKKAYLPNTVGMPTLHLMTSDQIKTHEKAGRFIQVKE